MMAPLILVIALFSLQHRFQCDAGSVDHNLDHNSADYDTHIGGTGNHSNVTSCIGTYIELESYVKGERETVIEKLKEAFFPTSGPPSKFVNFTYNFQVSNVNATNCSNSQSRFIWSENFLYLLGPQPLLYSTLFAVIVPEKDVTIDLPCLCHDVYGGLLSRLTYMSKVYAAMDYHDQPLQFISNNYFQAKSSHHGVYQSISTVTLLIALFSCLGMPYISFITVTYLSAKIYYCLEQYSVNLNQQHSQSKDVIKIIFGSLYAGNILINAILMVTHLVSVVEFISYGNEVFVDGDHYLPYLLAGSSSFAIGTMLVVAYGLVFYKTFKIFKAGQGTDFVKIYIRITASILISIVYIFCYFSPFMLLAFLHDPLITFSTYFLLLFALVNWILLTVIPFSYIIKLRNKHLWVKSRIQFIFFILCAFVVIFSSIYAFLAFTAFVVLTFLHGNFNSSQSLQGVLLSLLLAFISFFLLKPAYNTMRTHARLANSSVNSQEQTSEEQTAAEQTAPE